VNRKFYTGDGKVTEADFEGEAEISETGSWFPLHNNALLILQ
jgi:hypothetical protein